jgi:hypothetical protein
LSSIEAVAFIKDLETRKEIADARVHQDVDASQTGIDNTVGP